MYLIASTRPWNKSLRETLEARVGATFTLIDAQEQLTVENVARHQPRYIFFPHWSWMIPPEIYEGFECVIFHMTDLPYGRGGSPLQNLIVRGVSETRISALRCVEEVDAGPIYLKAPLSLEGTAQEIFTRANGVIEEMILEIIEGQPEPQPQEGEVVQFTRRRPEDGNMEPLKTPREVYDMIRMLDADGYPPAFVDVGRWRLEFSAAALEGEEVTAQVKVRERGDD